MDETGKQDKVTIALEYYEDGQILHLSKMQYIEEREYMLRLDDKRQIVLRIETIERGK